MMLFPLRRPSSGSRPVSRSKTSRSSSLTGSACAAFSTARQTFHDGAANVEPNARSIKSRMLLSATEHLRERRDRPRLALQAEYLRQLRFAVEGFEVGTIERTRLALVRDRSPVVHEAEEHRGAKEPRLGVAVDEAAQRFGGRVVDGQIPLDALDEVPLCRFDRLPELLRAEERLSGADVRSRADEPLRRRIA